MKIRTLTEELDELDREIKSLSGGDKTSRILQTMPGIGLIVAAAMIAVIGHPARFRNGRDMSAYLGLVPSQHTSGDKIRLGKITKRGDSGLRSLLVEGARAAILAAERTGSGKMKEREAPGLDPRAQGAQGVEEQGCGGCSQQDGSHGLRSLDEGDGLEGEGMRRTSGSDPVEALMNGQ